MHARCTVSLLSGARLTPLFQLVLRLAKTGKNSVSSAVPVQLAIGIVFYLQFVLHLGPQMKTALPIMIVPTIPANMRIHTFYYSTRIVLLFFHSLLFLHICIPCYAYHWLEKYII
jgi:hypothetical protein